MSNCPSIEFHQEFHDTIENYVPVIASTCLISFCCVDETICQNVRFI